MGTTKIPWTDETWSPVTGCTPVSEGCENCYARVMACRLRGRCGYPMDKPFRVTVHHDRLLEPNGWRKPRRCFVSSMGDLFHDNVSRDTILDVFITMATCPLSTFQVLTKRPRRMQEILCSKGFAEAVLELAEELPAKPGEPSDGDGFLKLSWPLPNVWVGTSCETQQRADERISALLQCPAAIHFVSLEPLFSPVDLLPYVGGWKNGVCFCAPGFGPRLKQVIIGCESRGSSLGRLSVDGTATPAEWWGWVSKIADQCVEAEVPLFIKQGPSEEGKRLVKMPALDGVVYNQMPETEEDG